MSFSPPPPPQMRTKGLGERGGGSNGARYKKCLTSQFPWTPEYSWSLDWKENEATTRSRVLYQYLALDTLLQVVPSRDYRAG